MKPYPYNKQGDRIRVVATLNDFRPPLLIFAAEYLICMALFHSRMAGRFAAFLASQTRLGRSRVGRRKASRVGRSVEEFIEKHTAFAIAIGVNAVIFSSLAGFVITKSLPQDEGVMLATLAFATEDDTNKRPPAAAATRPTFNAASAAVESAAQPASALSALLTTTPQHLQFDPAILPSVGVSAPSAQTLASASGSGNGSGTSTGSGHSNFGPNGFGGGKDAGKVNGMKIKAERLGVILDDSGSMYSKLAACIASIKMGFAYAPIVKIDGCKLVHVGDGFPIDAIITDVQANGKPHNTSFSNPNESDTEHAIVGLVLLDKVDAIYWFTDFEDDRLPGSLEAIVAFLTEHKVRLYIRVEGAPPPAADIAIVESTGGECDWASKAKDAKRDEREKR